MVAVADVFDALSSPRPYKKAFSMDQCLEILEEEGVNFDPRILDAFLRRKHDVIAVQRESGEQT